MYKAFTLFFVLIALETTCQEIEFYSDHILDLFIEAGADLDANGTISQNEAAQVTELFFYMEPKYGLQEISHVIDEYFPAEPNVAPYYQSSCTTLPGCSCGEIMGSYFDFYTLNFQGLEFFTSLQHLGIGSYFYEDFKESNQSIAVFENIENLHLPNSLKSFYLSVPALDPLVFPASLESCVIERAVVNADLSACENLKNFRYWGAENPAPILSEKCRLDRLELGRETNFSQQNLSSLRILKMLAPLTFDINVLENLEFLQLSFKGDININNDNVKTIVAAGCYDCPSSLTIENCSSLTGINVSRTNFGIRDNPVLNKVRVRDLSVSNTPNSIKLCPKLEYFNGSWFLNKLELDNLPALQHLHIDYASFDYLKIRNTPALEVLYGSFDDQGATMDVNFSELGKLRKLYLSNDTRTTLNLLANQSLSELQLIDNPNLELINVENSDLDGFIFNQSENYYLDDVQLVLSPNFNPRNLQLKNFVNPGINFAQFDRLERGTFIKTRGISNLNLQNCTDLMALHIADLHDLKNLAVCGASEDLKLYLKRPPFSTPTKVYVPFDDTEDALEFCIEGVATIAKECDDSVLFETNHDNALSIESEINNSPISIYPNPAKNIISWTSNEKSVESVKFYDLSGKMRGAFNEPGKFLDIGYLPEGMYVIQIHTDTETYTEKVLVEH